MKEDKKKIPYYHILISLYAGVLIFVTLEIIIFIIYFSLGLDYINQMKNYIGSFATISIMLSILVYSLSDNNKETLQR